uniref:Renin receptor-like C-terminal transmembrane spanning segment domain-containing protein n=1 Tax=Setaria digitata TaxID=48799 RepID=A0A915Q347_9BILA
MHFLRQFSLVTSKLNLSWNQVIASTRCLKSSMGSASNEVEGNLPSLDDSGSSTSGSELSNSAMDGVTQDRPILPYSQKALETLKLDKYPYYVEREWWKDGNRMTFWSTWRMKRDVKRRNLLAELGPDRVRLKALKCNTILPEMIRTESAKKLHNFPKGSCPNLVQHLCQFSGARRGKFNRFHLHRQIFRRLADHGQLSGIQRGVWLLRMIYICTVLVVLCLLVQGSLCAVLYFLASKPVVLPDPTATFLSETDVVEANKYMLGMTARAPLTWTSEGDIFERPRALAIVSVLDGKVLNNLSSGYDVTTEGEEFSYEDLVNNKIFADEGQEWILMRNAGLSGSQIASDAQNVFAKVEIKTRSEPLRREIENIYKIAEAIKKSETAHTKRTPTILVIDVNGLPIAKQELSEDEYKRTVTELENAIWRLISILKIVYDDRVIVELIAESISEVKTKQKRQSLESSADRIMKLRKDLNVYQFVSTNYPATFGIFLLVSVVLILAVLFIAVGLWNMDPSKDSIIYRVVTTRMKKD